MYSFVHVNLPLRATTPLPSITMSVTKAATSLVRATTRQSQLSALRPATAVQSRTYASGYDARYSRSNTVYFGGLILIIYISTSHAHFQSPFHRGTGEKPDTTVIPSFKNYRAGNETGNKVFQYFMVGAFGGLSALGAKDTVQSTHTP
jgi:ubiquinol-cytochrome c reductase iron-sulfur subunit